VGQLLGLASDRLRTLAAAGAAGGIAAAFNAPLAGSFFAPAFAKPALGGLALGAMFCVSPHLFGSGHATLDALLRGELAWPTLALLLVLKPVATSTTLASGGSGGVFLPSLYVGGLAGSLFGTAALALVPGLETSSGAYALVGMAAVLAGTSHAPLTALLLAFGLTQSHAVILPVMMAVALATFFSRALRRNSIYTGSSPRAGSIPTAARTSSYAACASPR
jgi:CIC family chloride channel protein